MVRKRPRKTYCWDTSVFLAWFNEEAGAPLGETDLILNQVHSGDASLLVPVTVFSEITESSRNQSQVAAFESFCQRSNIKICDITVAISVKAREIRDRGATIPKKGQQLKIKTPDAQIIATAIIYEAHILHSLEPRHHQLSGSPIVDHLIIQPPCDPSGQKHFRG